MKNIKRLLNVFLAVCLLLSGIPITALAAEPEVDTVPLLLYPLTKDAGTNEWSYPASPSIDDMIGAESLELSGNDANLFAAYLPDGQDSIKEGPLHPDLITVTGAAQKLGAEGFPLQAGCDRTFRLGYTGGEGNEFTVSFYRGTDNVSANITGIITPPTGPIGGELPAAGFYRTNERAEESLIDTEAGFEYSIYAGPDEPNEIFFLLKETDGIENVQIVVGQRFAQMDQIEEGVYKITVTKPNVAQFPLAVSWTENGVTQTRKIQGRHRDVNAMPSIKKYIDPNLFLPGSEDIERNLTNLEAVKILVGMREGLYPPDGKEIDGSDVTLSFTNMGEINALAETDPTVLPILQKAVKVELLGNYGEFRPNDTVPRYEMALRLAELCNVTGYEVESAPAEEIYNTYPENVEFDLEGDNSQSKNRRTNIIKFLCWQTDYINSFDDNFKPRMETTRAVAVQWADAIYQHRFKDVFLTGDRDDSEFNEYAIMFYQNDKQYELNYEQDGPRWTEDKEPIAGPPAGVEYDPAAKTLTLTNTAISQLEVNGRKMPSFDEENPDTFTLRVSGENTITSENQFGFTVMRMNTVITSEDEGVLAILPRAANAAENTAIDAIWINGSDKVTTTVSGNAQLRVVSQYADEGLRPHTNGFGFSGTGSLIFTDSAVVDVSGAGRMGIKGFVNGERGVTVMGNAKLTTDYIETDSVTIQEHAEVTVAPDFMPIAQAAIIGRRLVVQDSGKLTVDGTNGGGYGLVTLADAPEETRKDGGYYQSGSAVVNISSAGAESYPEAIEIANRMEVTGGELTVAGHQTGIRITRKATAHVANGTMRIAATGPVTADAPGAGDPVIALVIEGQTDINGGAVTAVASGGLYANQGAMVKAGNGSRGELTISGGIHTFTGGVGQAEGDHYGIFAEELGTVYVTGGTVTCEGGNSAAFADRPGADNCSFILGEGMHLVDHSDDAAHTSGDTGTPGTELAFLSDTYTSNEGLERHLYFLRKNNDASESSVIRAVVSETSGAIPEASRAEVTLRAQGSSPVAGSLISMIAEVDAFAGTKSLLTITLPAGMTLEPGSVTLNGEKLADNLASIPVIGPGTLRFSVKAAAAGSYTATATAANTQRQLASASCDLTVFPSFSINYPFFTSDTAEELPITGTAAPGSTVTLKAPAGTGSDKTVDVSSTGTYSTKIKLADYGSDWADSDRLELEAWTGGGKQEDMVITYLSGLPKLTSFDVLNYVRNGKKRYKDRVHYAHGAQDSGTEAKGRESASYIYWPGEDELKFEVKFHEIPESYQSDLRVRLTLSDGQTADSSLSYTSKGKKWDGRYTIRNENLPVGFTVVSLSGGTAIWSSEYISMTPIIDPSGYIYEGTKDNRVKGAAAKLYYIPDQASKPTGGVGSGTSWADAEKYLQINPIITGADGSFAWNVPVGWWRVQAEKDGLTGTSDWMHVLPAQTGVEVGLESSAPAELSSIVRSEDGKYLTLTFSKPVGVKDVYSETLPILDTNGQTVPGSYYPADGDNENAKSFYFVPDDPLPPKYVLGKLAPNSVTTYNEQVVAAADVLETEPPQDADDGSGEDDDPITPVGPSGPGGFSGSSTPDPVITENPDGSTTTTETADDGTVTATTTWGDGKQAVAVKSPEGEKTITVTTAAGEKVADVKLPAKPAEPKVFEDVKDDGWYKDAVDKATGYGLFNGTSDTKFSPDDGMTRGMLATVLHNLSGKPEYGTDTDTFNDVETGKWYENPVDWAYKVGVTSGTSDTEFSPDKDITREQLVTMLYRYAEKIGAASNSRTAITGFPDGDQVAGYAQDAMQWAVAEGFISGRAEGGKNYIAPQGTATRAEVAAVLTRFVEYLKK